MLCPSCGQPIRLGSRLCTSCGMWLLDDDASAGGQHSAPPPPPRQAPPASSLWAPPRASDRVDEPPPAGMGGFATGGFSAPIVNDIDEHTIPQEGKIAICHGGRDYDLQVHSRPTPEGEQIIMEIHPLP